MSRLLTRYSIPSILVLKVLVLAYIFAGDRVLIYFGEKNILGADEEKAKTESAPAEAKEASDKPASSDESESKRRGYLDDLLNMPKVNTDGLKKDEIGRYLTLLERKQSQVENRIQILKAREDQLKSLEGNLDTKLKKIEDEMLFFQQTVQKEKDLKGERLDKLVEFYQKMEPKKAAVVFEKLDKDLIVQLFNRFPQKQTTQILSLMNPDRSVELSEYYGRLRSSKEYEILKEVNTSLRKEFQDCKGLPAKVQ